jgi:MFS family permease
MPPQTNAVDQPKRRWWTVLALSAAAFIDSSEDNAIAILWTRMYPALGLRVGQLGFVLSITGIIRTLTLPLWGTAADRFSRKKLLVGITGMWGLWTLAIAFVQDLPQLMIVRVLSSLGLGVLWPAAFSLLSDLFASHERGKAAGVMTAVSFTGTIASYAILPALAGTNPEGWRTGFLVMGIASAISGLLLLVVNDPPRGSSEPELRGIAVEAAEKFSFRLADLPLLAGVRTWWVLLVHTSLDYVGLSILYAWAFTWLDGLGLGENGFIIVSLLATGNLLGHLFFGWLGDVLEKRSPHFGRAAMAMIGLLLTVPALAVFLALGPGNHTLLFISGIITGVTLSSVDTGARWPMAQAILPPELRASGRASLDMLVGIVASIAAAISGSLVDSLGVASMMLIIILSAKTAGMLSWIPIFWTYPGDCARVSALLTQRRSLLEEKPSPLIPSR